MKLPRTLTGLVATIILSSGPLIAQTSEQNPELPDKPQIAQVVAQQTDENPDFKHETCYECHSFSEQELAAQIDRIRSRHLRARQERTSCVDCHDREEVEEICCHAKNRK